MYFLKFCVTKWGMYIMNYCNTPKYNGYFRKNTWAIEKHLGNCLSRELNLPLFHRSLLLERTDIPTMLMQTEVYDIF